MTATTVFLKGYGGEEIEAYLVRPHSSRPRAGVLVVHHMPGWDRYSKEVARRFAELGYDAICPNLYWRDGPGAAPDDAAAAARAKGGVPDDRAAGDLAGALDYLRALEGANGKVGVIGYCSGGRQTVLLACRHDFDAAVDCYGAFVTGQTPPGFPLVINNLEAELPNLRVPLLGLFGAEDQHPSAADVERLEQLLARYGKEFTLRTYPGAGHSFFWPERPSYRVEAASDGWAAITEFFGKQLGVPQP